MNRYEPRLPRAAFGVGAAALTALTFGLLVAAPAHVSSGAADAPTLAAKQAPSVAPSEVTLERIEVVARRDQRRVVDLVRHDVRKPGDATTQAI